VSGQQWKVLNNLLLCHTPALGGRIYRCDNCSHTFHTLNSCRDRHCPSCQSVARAAWVEKRLDELLPVGYFHVVFTVPQQLNAFALCNKKVFYDILFHSVSETLLTLGSDPRWHGGTIGFISVLHTWGQNLMDHPHVHCIIPGGGIRADGKKWKAFRDNYLFPVKVMSLLFRRVFMQNFIQALDNRTMQLHGRLQGFEAPETRESFFKMLKNKNWVVYAKKPFATPARVVKYVGSYTHRIAIANSRLLSMENGEVSFKWKDYREPTIPKTMRLKTQEFTRRFLMHVLPAGFVRIRYYGFLSNKDRQHNIKRCMKMLNKKYRTADLGRTIQSILAKTAGIDITRCRECSTGRYQTILETRRIRKRRQARYNTHGDRYRESTLRSRERDLAFGRSTQASSFAWPNGLLRPSGETLRRDAGASRHVALLLT